MKLNKILVPRVERYSFSTFWCIIQYLHDETYFSYTINNSTFDKPICVGVTQKIRSRVTIFWSFHKPSLTIKIVWNSFHIYVSLPIAIHDDDVQPILHGVGDARMGGFTFTCQNGCIK